MALLSGEEFRLLLLTVAPFVALIATATSGCAFVTLIATATSGCAFVHCLKGRHLYMGGKVVPEGAQN